MGPRPQFPNLIRYVIHKYDCTRTSHSTDNDSFPVAPSPTDKFANTVRESFQFKVLVAPSATSPMTSFVKGGFYLLQRDPDNGDLRCRYKGRTDACIINYVWSVSVDVHTVVNGLYRSFGKKKIRVTCPPSRRPKLSFRFPTCPLSNLCGVHPTFTSN